MRDIPNYLPSVEQQKLYTQAIEGEDPGPYPDRYNERKCRVVRSNTAGQYYVIFEKHDTPRWVSQCDVQLGE